MTLQAIDYVEIYQLYSRYNFAIDFGNVDEIVATFTPDGSFAVDGLPEDAPAAGTTVGHSGLKSMFATLVAGLAGHSRHVVSPANMIIEGDENEVRSRSYLIEVRPGVVPLTGVYLTGIYHDVIRRLDGNWLFASRTVRMDPQPGAGVPTDFLVVEFDKLHAPS